MRQTFEKPIIELLNLNSFDIIKTSDFGEKQRAGYSEDDFEDLEE